MLLGILHVEGTAIEDAERHTRDHGHGNAWNGGEVLRAARSSGGYATFSGRVTTLRPHLQYHLFDCIAWTSLAVHPLCISKLVYSMSLDYPSLHGASLKRTRRRRRDCLWRRACADLRHHDTCCRRT